MSEDQADPKRFVRRYEALLAQVRGMLRRVMHTEEQIEAELSEVKSESEKENL